jgi:hypothetical protein
MPSPVYEFKLFKYSSHCWILKILEPEKGRLKILDVETASGYLKRDEGLCVLTRCWKTGLGYQVVVAVAPGNHHFSP